MVNREIARHGLELRLSTELASIEDDGRGRVAAVVTRAGERLPCQIVGLTVGVSPNLDVVKDAGLRTGRGVLVDRCLRTSAPDVYAAGDCAEIELPGQARNLLQQVWYTGKLQGEVAGDNLSGDERAYEPGIWFNSAKFLDLEYQTYGRVNLSVPGERSLYWEHASGRKSLRLVHVDGKLIGVNVIGLRFRHAVCERWIAEGCTLPHVIARLGEACFDPEFSPRHEREITAAFAAQGMA